MTQSILLISYFAPCRGHAGGLRLLELYKEIKRIIPEISLKLVACSHPDVDWGVDELEQIFDKVYLLSTDKLTFKELLSTGVLSKSFDCIDLQYHQTGTLIADLKKYCPRTRIIFSPMESMIRSAQLALLTPLQHFSSKQILQYVWLALQEAYYVMKADSIICVSELDYHSLCWLKKNHIFCVSTGLLFNAQIKSHQRTEIFDKVIVFSAFFGSKTNIDALLWFIKLVHPIIKTAVSDYTFKIVGRGAAQDLVNQCQIDGVQFVGEVQGIEKELQFASLGIAPALSGAGFRGKINQYAAVSLPCVATSIAADGFKYEHEKNILIADSPLAFAESCIKLLVNKEYSIQIGQAAQKVCLAHYTWLSMEEKVIKAYNLAPEKNER